jgi:hypothetical protein
MVESMTITLPDYSIIREYFNDFIGSKYDNKAALRPWNRFLSTCNRFHNVKKLYQVLVVDSIAIYDRLIHLIENHENN